MTTRIKPGVPILIDDQGRIVGYVDENGKERRLNGELIDPGTTPDPDFTGGGSVSWDDIADKPATFPPNIGTSAVTAKAGNWLPAATDVSVEAFQSAGGNINFAGGNAQQAIQVLADAIDP